MAGQMNRVHARIHDVSNPWPLTLPKYTCIGSKHLAYTSVGTCSMMNALLSELAFALVLLTGAVAYDLSSLHSKTQSVIWTNPHVRPAGFLYCNMVVSQLVSPILNGWPLNDIFPYPLMSCRW